MNTILNALSCFDRYRSGIVATENMLARHHLEPSKNGPLCNYLHEMDKDEEMILQTEEELDKIRDYTFGGHRMGIGIGCSIQGICCLGLIFTKIAVTAYGVFNKSRATDAEIAYLQSLKIISGTSIAIGAVASVFFAYDRNAQEKAKKVAYIRIDRLFEKVRILDIEIKEQKQLNISYRIQHLNNQIIPLRNKFEKIAKLYERIDGNSGTIGLRNHYGPSGVSYSPGTTIPARTEYRVEDKWWRPEEPIRITTREVPETRTEGTYYPEGDKEFVMQKSISNGFIKV